MDKYLLHNAIKLSDVNNQLTKFSQFKSLGTSIFACTIPSQGNQTTLESILKIRFDEKNMANNVIALDTLTGLLKGKITRILKDY